MESGRYLGNYVDIAGISEGDILEKESINQTKNSWSSVDGELGEIHIREEGLDRRVFAPSQTWADSLDGQSRCYVSSLYPVNQPVKSEGWVEMTTGLGKQFRVVGGVSDVSPKIAFEWDPEIHTYAIIRASLWFRLDVGMIGDRGRDSTGDKGHSVSSRNNQFFKFGIHVTAPGESTERNRYVRRIDQQFGRIFCPVQVGLNSHWSKSTNQKNYIAHPFDRRTALASAVTMVVGGQSWETDSSPDLTLNLTAIDMRRAGQYQAALMMRGLPSSRYNCQIAGSPMEGNPPTAEIGHIQFFAQVFRR